MFGIAGRLVALFFSLSAAAQPVDSGPELRSMLQAAPPGSTVRLAPREYWIAVDASGVGLEIPSGITLDARGATIRLIENALTGYHVISIGGTDSHLRGGVIVGDRDRHLGKTGEWGMCISVRGATNVSIQGTTVRDCWGDGIYVGIGKDSKQPSRNITIEDVQAVNNRRNNISLVAVDGFRVSKARLQGANGHDPQAGIDLEPNRGDVIANGVLSDIEAIDNAGRGVVFGGAKGTIRNVRLERIRSLRNGDDGFWIQSGKDVQARGLIATDNASQGLSVVLMEGFTLTDYTGERNGRKLKTKDVRIQDSKAITMERMTADGQPLTIESPAVNMRRSNTVTIR